ncbi:MAG: hypothetical protein ABI904_19565 [Chloroflexota bacterium]
MIPIRPQAEPNDFNGKVRQPGQIFLANKPNPKNNEWKGKDYWRICIPDLYELYGGICAYSAQWIPLETGVATVDHFEPKAVFPHLAYEWTNFRLASSKLNSRKGSTRDVIDPFTLSNESFQLDFPSLLMKPNPALSDDEKTTLLKTIDRLKLNFESGIRSRLRWVRDYSANEINFDYLQKNAPFIAYELERQGLRETIKEILSM